MDLIVNILRWIFFFLDSLIYNFIVVLYNLFSEIAETTIFTDEIIEMFASKVYTLLGVFMLFKVSFSILSYIVNPDDFLDKSKGFSKIISNIIITFILLLLTPFIFSEAMDIQRIVLKNNVIGKIFTSSSNNTVVVDPGNFMAYETFKAFYHINTDLYYACDGIEDSGYEDTEDMCFKLAFNSDQERYNSAKETFEFAERTNSISIYMDYGLVNHRGTEEKYVMYYLPFVSTIAGGALALLLIVFCFDIAVRSVKLGFLRMIAPIPIVSRIDPKKGKETFDKWVKSCFSTYLDLFIRLLAIYFAVFVITQLSNLRIVDSVTNEEREFSLFVNVFIILGALLFAKQLPQLISDLTGIKLDGKFTLNPMNKVRQVPLVGAGLTTAAALAGGAYTGFKAGAQANNPLRGMWQGAMGARRDIKGKVPLMGAEKGGKSPRAFYSGMQAGHKTITGRDYETFDPWKMVGHDKGEDTIDEYKKSKYALQKHQAELDAQLQTYYDELKHITDDNEREKKMAQIRKNRSDYGKISKYISVIDDQIKDVKRLYHIDESPKKDLNDALGEAKKYLELNNENAPSAPPSSSPSAPPSSSSKQPEVTKVSEPTTITTANGSKVTVNPGESYTPSGIILPSDYDKK